MAAAGKLSGKCNLQSVVVQKMEHSSRIADARREEIGGENALWASRGAQIALYECRVLCSRTRRM